jgi:antitoxin component of RelBE/YafQ-DinJ toxin-antitoxin module
MDFNHNSSSKERITMAAKKNNKYAKKPRELVKRFAISCYCTQETKSRFKKLADRKNISESDLVNQLIAHCLKEGEALPVEPIPEEATFVSPLAEAQKRAKLRHESESVTKASEDPVFNGNSCPKCSWGMFDLYKKASYPFDMVEACCNCDHQQIKLTY